MWVIAVEQHGRRRRRVGPAVEHEAGLDLDDLAVRRRRGGASRSSPGGGGRGRGSSRRGCRPSAPGGRARSASRHVCTCRLMSSRAPNAPPTPPSTSRTCSSGRPRQAAICLRSSCSHCVAMCSSTPRPSWSGMATRRLEAEERLVLHPDLVGALDDDVAGGVDVAAADPLVAQHVAVGVDRRVRAVDRRLRDRAAARAPRRSTTIAASARRHVSGWSAATAATGSPT